MTAAARMEPVADNTIEAAKYRALWDRGEYRIMAPGEHCVAQFLSLARPGASDVVLDFGCGTGRAAAAIAEYATVVALDFADNCLDDTVRAQLGEHLSFRQHDLTQPLDFTARYGFCTDVMEHIPPADVETVLQHITTAGNKVYFNISLVPDHMGALIGESLHLTVEPFAWWKEKLESIGFRIDFSEDRGESAVFWGSVYANGDDVTKLTGLNISEDRVRSNMLANLALGFNEVCPHAAQEETIYVLAGGPSLMESEAEIIELGRAGAKFVTCNGTYRWLLERGIRPAAHFMVDGREFNERFIHTIVDTCQYIFSSQTAHEAVKKVPPEQGWLYHSDAQMVREVFEEHCRESGTAKEWYPVPGGTTVISRGLVVLAMLGFRKIDIFGWDSCLIGDEHHAYEQKENDDRFIIEVYAGSRKFRCHPWMVVQANEVPKLIRHIFGVIDGFKINVRGDGLIAHMLAHAANLATTKGI